MNNKSVTPQGQRLFPTNSIVRVISMLRSNPVYDCGFRISRYDNLVSRQYCFCPLSIRFERVHSYFDICSLFGPDGNHQCKHVQAMSPRELVDHLWHHRQTSFYHDIVYEYIDNLYGDYWLSGIKHEALYNLKSTRLIQAQEMEQQSKGYNVCGLSVSACPSKILHLVPRETTATMYCSIKDNYKVSVPQSEPLEIKEDEVMEDSTNFGLDDTKLPPILPMSNTTDTPTKHKGHAIHPSRLKQVAKLNLLATNPLSKINNSTLEQEIKKLTTVVKPSDSINTAGGIVIDKPPPIKPHLQGLGIRWESPSQQPQEKKAKPTSTDNEPSKSNEKKQDTREKNIIVTPQLSGHTIYQTKH